MTERTDVSRVIEWWLADGASDAVPDRVLATVAAELPRTRQQRTAFGMALSWRYTALAASLVLVTAASLAVYGVLRPSPVVPPGSPTPTVPTSPTVSPTASPTPPPFTSAPFHFRAQSPLVSYGPWANFLYAPIANGTALTFPDGKFVGGDVWSAFIVVSSGTRGSGPVVGVSFPPTPSGASPPANPDWAHASLVRIWSADVDQLAADYVATAGGTLSGEVELDGERAIRIVDANEMAEVLVAVHGRRAFVLGTTTFLQPTTASPGWDRFLASFRFLD